MKSAKQSTTGTSTSVKTSVKALTIFSKAPRIQPREIRPAVVMGDAQRLSDALSNYFKLQVTEEAPPTFEGLALAAGFSSFSQMKQALFDDKHSQVSKDTIVIACARIADHYQQCGLLERLNPGFIKYLLSAYLNISERSIAESQHTEDKTITVRWQEGPLDVAAPTKEAIKQTTKDTRALADELADLELEDLL